MNQTTSSTDQVVGSLLAGALDSWDSDGALYPKKRDNSIFVSHGVYYRSSPDLLFLDSPTRPVAFWEGVGAGG